MGMSVKHHHRSSSVRVDFVVCPRNVNTVHIRKVIAYLSKRGIQAKITFLDDKIVEIQEGILDSDLYIPKVLNEFGMYYVALLEKLGAQLINSYKGIAICRDKILAALFLKSIDIRIPPTYIVNSTEALREIVSLHPIIVKPFRISEGYGHRKTCIIWSWKDICKLGDASKPILAQKFLLTDGWDRKLYVVDEMVYGMMRPSFSKRGQIRRFQPSEELVEIAFRIGENLGLSIYGVDIIQSQGEFYVVDVNDFPSFRNVSGAIEKIAELITRRCNW